MNFLYKGKACTNISTVHLGSFKSTQHSVKGRLRDVLPLMVGDGVDGLELDGVLRFVHTELTAALFSAVLKFSYSDAPYWKKHKD